MHKCLFSLILISFLFSWAFAKLPYIKFGEFSTVTVPCQNTGKENVFKALALSYPLEESFEGSFPPENWLVISNGNADEEWAATDEKHRSGEWSAYIHDCWMNYTMDEWLITPAIDLSLSPSAKLIFYEDEDFWSGYGVHHYVKISVSSQDNLDSFQTLLDMNPGNHTINGFDGDPVEIDLTNFIGEDSVYIAFQYIGSNADYWYLDDICVSVPLDHDICIDSTDMEEQYEGGVPIQPLVWVENIGLNVESFTVSFGYFDWNENPIVIDTKTVENLGVGSTQRVEFSDYVFENDIQYIFFFKVNLINDMNHRNDLIEKIINTFTHKKSMILIEKATSTHCGCCPGSALAVDHLYHNYPDSLAILEYHCVDDFSTDLGNSRISFYDLNPLPSAIFNGTNRKVGGASFDEDWSSVYQDYEQLYKNAREEKTPFSLDLESSISDTKLTAIAEITYSAVSMLRSYRIFYAINESHIPYQWEGMDSLHFVVRAMAPDVHVNPGEQFFFNGNPLYEGEDSPVKGMVFSDTVSFNLSEMTGNKNFQLIAFIQDMDTKEIMETAKVDFVTPPSSIIQEMDEFFPRQFILYQNYPNPFNPDTWIQFDLPDYGYVEAAIYNIQGKLVKNLISGSFQAGQHKVCWNGKNNDQYEVSSGVYILRIKFKEMTLCRKLIKIK
jgi:hypothetical protein